ncbi:hypothetical protein [Celeribacter sp. ULVN23_4]
MPHSSGQHSALQTGHQPDASQHEKGVISRQDQGWGYSLVRLDGMQHLRARCERLIRLLAILCFVAMGGLWLLPGATFSLSVIGIKAALSISLGLAGLAFGHLAERGLTREVQIDLQRFQVRVVWRNRKSDTRLITVVAFEEIGSVFLRRVAGARGLSALNLRYGRDGDILPLLTGEEGVLREVWADLNMDLRPKSAAQVRPQRVMQPKNRKHAAQMPSAQSSSAKPATRTLPRAFR